jgi:hypothetical protein
MICVEDYAGDWDALDAAFQKVRGSGSEARWSHLLDLTARLSRAGLTAEGLAGEAMRTGKARAKIRKKVMESTLYDRHLAPAMRNLPSTRLRRQTESGFWGAFPSSPGPWYDLLSRKFDVNDNRYVYGDGWATQKMAWNLLEASAELVKKSGADVAQVLAIRRATLRLYHDAAEGCDDSYGGLGEAAHEQIVSYASTDWRSSGIAAEVFWRDLLMWCISGDDYGLVLDVEAEVLQSAQIGQDRDLIDKILVELSDQYTAARQGGRAGAAQLWRKYVADAGTLPNPR